MNKTEYLNISWKVNIKEAIIDLNSWIITGSEDFKKFIKYFLNINWQKNL